MYSLNLPRMFYDMADDHAIIIDSATGNYFMLNIIASKVFLYLPGPYGLPADFPAAYKF